MDPDRHPVLTFSSTAEVPAGTCFRIIGDLTVPGVTRTVVLDLEQTDAGTDPEGSLRLSPQRTPGRRGSFQRGSVFV
ncbi:YceI family protein [Streptomyces canus]|uniref:YceI family protein n=1 Tax=Streptomyces canus TaxID=58343 RepID=UPI0033D5100C